MSGTSEKAQSFEFKAEIKQLLDILIHSVYTSKDIFVRELVSNAADALEKVRFTQVQGGDIHEPDRELEIRIETTKSDDANTLIISDSGIGMTEEEVRTNIGTIAHSGATAFLEKLRAEKSDGSDDEAKNVNLIGRFGVGFYSVFMAADRVVLTTRSATPDARPVMWSSDGLGSYTIENAPEDTPRGTRVEIHLRDGEERFAEDETIATTIRRYSNFIPFPVFVGEEKANRTQALWREQPSQIKDEDYDEFFKYLSHGEEEPTLRLHMNVDAPIQFSALLFIPKANTEIMGFGEGKVSLQLYVKRVLIDGENENLLPQYLRFARGVVESEDLPLNISRETFQENAIVMRIRETLTRKLLDKLLELAEKDSERYDEFWSTFGRFLKEGHADYANREKLSELLRFNCSTHEDEKGLIGLASYVETMPGAQKDIYYLTGASRDALERDARLELFRKKGIPVLYLSEFADEFVLGGMGQYKEHKLVSADRVKPEDLSGIGENVDAAKDAESEDTSTGDAEALIERFREILGERVIDVRASERLVDSPACLVSDEEGLSGHMDKMLRMMNKDSELPKRVLEVNPKHPLISNLTKILEGSSSDPFVEQACEQLFEGAMLLDGYLTDPHQLVERMNRVLDDSAALRVKSDGPEDATRD